MDKQFKILKTTRENILKTIVGLTNEQLNEIPNGLKNNVIWNVGHVLVTQQLLVYGLSNLPFKIDKSLIELFRKGTVVNSEINEEVIQSVKSNLKTTVQQCKEDYNNHAFSAFQQYETSYNITLTSVEDAIIFNNIHEGLHYGYIMAMKKMLK